MIRYFIKTSLLLLAFFISAPFANVYAQSINGGWLTNSGDLLFMVKSTKNKVIVMDISAAKTLRYVFTGTMTGDQIAVATSDGATTLDATVTGQTLAGVITPATDAPQTLTANLYFAYNGSNYDGLWKTDGAEEYLLYASMKLKGVTTTLVPYFSIHSDKTVTYNLFMGAPAVTDTKGNTSFAGMSMLDYAILKMDFTSTTVANASITKEKKVTKFTTSKIYAVTKKSGEY